ncbi:2-C-methyl-D-erythritol 4-phosphate cytidylyltransferase [Branchiibius hedensis]|uniref:2-C-methyl-D-erythritol 4-phosphate cytidylyltransferase n=1 Tax=Branchiibius hedensis TaxID=672460 RepID=A0A2Y9BUA5_9MICO|nr:2-C-methyl-D-erythritol 4-phosphate cytidylyltransferase [Branchiibius hedensis]PWJ26590.1 2-C-methyl-D-erythritol 4-phosphate cytidylyltransferase [Branchiibius hedensis]SSA35402.1 2-C-methyl-D-erythritol 4-phosphate cytidylyltransferase [Branchiibius hedensis]
MSPNARSDSAAGVASSVAAIVVAAGRGTRLDAGIPKALVPLAGEPLVVHAVRRVRACEQIGPIVVVAPGDVLADFVSLLDSYEVTVVAGGAERTDSVGAGLAVLPSSAQLVLVHDAARALTPPALFDAVIAAVRDGADAVVPGVAVSDTIKQVDDTGQVLATLDRSALRAIQTPQGFTRAALVAAHASGDLATDDAALVEKAGGVVRVIEGSALAAKVTTQVDLRLLTELAAQS